MSLRNDTDLDVTADSDSLTPEAIAERFRIYRLCDCEQCGGTGSDKEWIPAKQSPRCEECRGEGKVRQLVATAPTPESVGTAMIQLGREGEFVDCPVGLLDTLGEKGRKWLINPWLPSARNVSEAARVLARKRNG